MKKYPIIKVLKSKGGGSYLYWCPFCNRFHCHSSEEGYSITHCVNKSSPYFKAGGVILKECTKDEIEKWNLPINYNSKNEK